MVSIEMGYQYVSSLTMNKSVQLKERELRLLALFLLIILEMRSSATLEYTACFYSFRKL